MSLLDYHELRSSILARVYRARGAVERERLAGCLHGQRLPRGGVVLIADVQYGDASRRGNKKLHDRPEDGRFYSQTLGTFVRSAREARRLGAKSMVLLGDQIDDHDRAGDVAAAKVLDLAKKEFGTCPIGYLLGNHDTKWSETFRQARERSQVTELPGHFVWECSVDSEDGSLDWVMIALDGHATSSNQHGSIGPSQIAWLRSRLLVARAANKNVVLCSHVPLHFGNSLPGSQRKALCTPDGESVRRVLKEVGNVRLCLAGHDHAGAYFLEDDIHYFTLPACLAVPGPPDLSGVVLRFYHDHVVLAMLEGGGIHRVPYLTSVRPDSSRLGLPYVFDMETGDPDDVLTLLFLCSKTAVQLRAVTITPGTQEQVSLIGWILREVGMSNVRIGASNWPANASKIGCLQGKFYDNFGRLEMEDIQCEPADRVLFECCDGGVTLVTGAALTNLGAALELNGFRLGRWVAQGGFAGEGVVPTHLQMPKFKGKETCQTYNFQGNVSAAQAALASPHIGRRVCVSKNVCHQTAYTNQWQKAVGAAMAKAETSGRGSRFKSLQLIYLAMKNYMRTGKVKKLHDPLALAVAIDESVCELAEVAVFHSTNPIGWGSRLAPGSGTWISIDFDLEKFQSVLLTDTAGA